MRLLLNEQKKMEKKNKPVSPLRIAMFGHKRIPSREGGIEVVVDELSTRMVALGHSVTCFNRSGYNVSGSEFDEKIGDVYKGVKLKNVWTINKKGLAAMTASVSAAFHAKKKIKTKKSNQRKTKE